MEQPLRIYLSGSIRKGNTDPRPDHHFWSEADEQFVTANAGVPEVELLNPAKTKLRRSDFGLNFGCDLFLVSISNIVLVDARKEKGIGVGAEMMFAAQNGIPVITWAPPESHYRRRFVPNVFGEDLHDWTHPFVFGLSDHVVDDLLAAMELVRAHTRGELTGRWTCRGISTAILPANAAQLMPDKLAGPHGELLVHLGGDVWLATEDIISPEVELDGRQYLRFMDQLLIPWPTSSFPLESILAINRWRERLLARTDSRTGRWSVV